eukprot:GILI01015884.1.p1 GENE.GILI01015884.1~~GILI01015884.1.p1  ORF type:complete len:216 (-),score=34.41 GILI01015884.1:316-876(-)
MKARTKFIIHIVILVIFAIAYIIGVMAVMFNNVGATAGFGTTAFIIMAFIGMKLQIGYRSIEEQLQLKAEKQAILANEGGVNLNCASAIITDGDKFPLRCIFRSHPEPFLAFAMVCFVAAFTGSMTYMGYAIKNKQTYDMDSYWMAFMAFLMAAKWCFGVSWLMRRMYREKVAYLAARSKMAPMVV